MYPQIVQLRIAGNEMDKQLHIIIMTGPTTTRRYILAKLKILLPLVPVNKPFDLSQVQASAIPSQNG